MGGREFEVREADEFVGSIVTWVCIKLVLPGSLIRTREIAATIQDSRLTTSVVNANLTTQVV